MAVSINMEIQNLKSSILFMQQEHSNTLKALHLEIHNLQKRCSGLMFQLAMETTSNSPSVSELQSKLISLETELSDKNTSLKISSDLVEKKEKKINNMEQQIRAQERKFTDELKRQKKLINQLQQDSDSKANNIAYLTNQLYQFRRSHPLRESDSSAHITSDSVLPGDYTDINTHRKNSSPLNSPIQPIPPKEDAPRFRRKSLGTSGDLVIRPGSGRRRSATPFPQQTTPDLFPLLEPNLSQSNSFTELPKFNDLTILPPIATVNKNDQAPNKCSDLNPSVISLTEYDSKQLVHEAFKKNKSFRENAPPPEIEKLAIKSVVKTVSNKKCCHMKKNANDI